MEHPRLLPFTANEEVRGALARTGRTEDVQFSPEGLRLVLPGAIIDRLLILDVAIQRTPSFASKSKTRLENRNRTSRSSLRMDSAASRDSRCCTRACLHHHG